MRRYVIAGNWKMNMLPNEAIEFMNTLAPMVKDTKNEVIICAPFTDLFYTILSAQQTNIHVGAQNMHWEESGAYTGEVSPNMLKCINTEYVIIGHSERRQYFNETDETVNKKVKAALKHGLKPIVCVGETLEQREAGQTVDLITGQVEKGLAGLTAEDLDNVIIAYEPIWAIGTGKTATNEEANEAIKEIRNKVREEFNTDDITILYGGSCNDKNAKELFSMSDIDGGLVGGASLKAEQFEKIVNFN
ncbi:MAG: triose-phosphate isomerase [Clostridia bacterium]|nr:triose-phosphate isomerase [Clostridia bacterium]